MIVNKFKINKTELKDNTLSLSIGSSFLPTARQHESIETKFSEIKDSVINEIIDYEKVKLHPIVTVDDKLKVVDRIQYNLHFTSNGKWDDTPSSISSAGFSGEDITNRRKRLSHSFLRLSFYDSDNLKTQNLLYTSTIFFDINDLYMKYLIEDKNISKIKFEFVVENPKISDKRKSFEGDGLYLFKNDIDNSDVYMRVDFNNALNGKSLLFAKTKPNMERGFTLKELKDNMFIKCICERNELINKYTYKMDGVDINNIDLYQVRVL